MKVAVGMSGGVDSSVAALLLKEKGYEVVGVSMAIWNDEYSVSCTTGNACFGPDEKEGIETAKRVCDMIGIPFFSINCAEHYEEMVLGYFRREYLSGRTPNPCVKCNQLVKFGVLPDGAEKAGLEFDVFATGHYARIEHAVMSKRYLLKKAKDRRKDQSYFLYRLSQYQLSRTIFPLGDYFKDEVKDIAVKHGLPACGKSDSQDFYTGDWRELLSITEREGDIVDRKGNILGKHKGIWNYTIGQRRGLGVSSSRPLYVVELNKERNEVVAGSKNELYKNAFFVNECNWISIGSLSAEMDVFAKLRSTHAGAHAMIKPIEDSKVHVTFSSSQESITPGQSAVFYSGDIVVGGGIINELC